MAFTETQLLPQEANQELVQNSSPFTLYRQDHSTDKYSSMAVCTRSTVEITNVEYIPLINALKFKLVYGNLQDERTFLLLYRKQSLNSAQYIRDLTTVMNRTSIDVVFGDFNINYMSSTQSKTLRSLMTSLNYSQIVTNPTFFSSGSLLDHVYGRLTGINITVSVINVYYSDHDAVQLTIQY